MNNLQQQNNQAVQQNQQVFNYEVNGENIVLSEMDVVNFLVNGNGNIEPKEVIMFMNLCKYQKLNPFLKEAYLIKFNGHPAQLIVSKEAFMKRAESHPKFEGFEAGIIVERNGEMIEIEGAVKLKSDVIVGGWCRVYRSDRKFPVITKISYEEFSKGQSTWKSMPLNMIRKSAVVNGLREAFPDNLGAMYTEEEATIKDMGDIEEVRQEIAQNANTEAIDFEPVQELVKDQAKEPVRQFVDTPTLQDEIPLDDPGF